MSYDDTYRKDTNHDWFVYIQVQISLSTAYKLG